MRTFALLSAVGLTLLPTVARSAAGDFNGDGFADLAIGVPFEDLGGLFSPGAVNVIQGSAAGLTAAGDQFLHQNSAGVLGTGAAFEFFGWALAAGDFDNDGFADLAVGVHSEDIGAIDSAGAVNVLQGSAAGLTAAGDQLWQQGAGGLLDAAEAFDHFGSALAAGDFNADGFADLAIGVYGEDIGAIGSAGAVQVLLGSAIGLTSVGNQIWHQNSGGIDDTAEASDFFGSALAAGDFNADGFADLAIGVHNESVGAVAGAGMVHVLLGSGAGLTSVGSQLWSQDSGNVLDFVEAGDEFGRALATGDFNQDGFDDLAIGVPSEDLLVAGAGSVNMLLGSAAGLTDVGNDAWHQEMPGIEDTAEADDRFGHTLAAADFDADGIDDLAIGVVDEDVGALANAGAVNMLLGSPGGLSSVDDQFWSQDSGGTLGVAEADEQFGNSLAAGDFDNDGFADLAVGVFAENQGAIFAVGAVNILPGSATGLTAAGDQRWHQNSAGILDTAEFGDGFGTFGRGP